MNTLLAILDLILHALTGRPLEFASQVRDRWCSVLDGIGATAFGVTLEHYYHVECYGADGVLKWVEDFANLVVTEGRNKYLDATLKTGLASPAWYVGLVDNAGYTAYAAGDTAAQINGTNGWDESSAYSEAARQTFTPGTISAGSVDNSASKAVFSINGTVTVRGAFLVSSSTKGGTTGTLLGVGDFTGGSRSLINGDTLNVTVTASIAAS